MGSPFRELLDQRNRGCLPHVVRSRLEGKSPNGKRHRLQFSAEELQDLGQQESFLRFVHLLGGSHDREIDTLFLGGMEQGPYVFGKTGSPVTHAGKEKGMPDPAVRSDRFANLRHVRPDRLAKARDFVHEADTARQHGVGGVLRNLGAGGVHHQDRVTGPHERTVQLGHQLADLCVVGTDDYTIGTHEVLDGSALLQELRVGGYSEALWT